MSGGSNIGGATTVAVPSVAIATKAVGNDPSFDRQPSVLAFTGMELEYLLVAGFALLLCGVVMLALGRNVKSLPTRSD